MRLIAILLFLLPAISFAQSLPGSEIYLFDLSVKEKEIVMSNPKNITNHPGYDNQPFFHPDKTILYYSSEAADGRTDILQYNFSTNTVSSLTKTHEREYSPTLTPDKKFISCIIQRDNGAQDLGKYPVDGGEPTILIDNMIVGYHAWIDSDNLLLFVLGDVFTLQHYTVSTASSKIVADSIGRSLHKIPGRKSMSFIEKKNSGWVIQEYNPDTNTVQLLDVARPQREDLCWLPDGRILMSDQDMIYSIDPERKNSWTAVTIENIFPGKSISRIAVNSGGTKIAVVVTE